ncbi:MAG: acyltransferase domain-containing protein, partial [Chloroflexi bacterium]|nr:acyltransferase domain-containing protein [Chloroflexota bacterium]
MTNNYNLPEPFTDEFDDDELEHIAIIGMSGRFPKANNVNTFWENLRAGLESLTHFTAEELIEAGQNPALVNNPNYVKARHVLENVDQFDASFFDILPSEAQVLDPQHRLFLECAWEALETAGHNPQLDDSITGVFAGAGTNNYMLANLWSNRALLAQMGNMTLATASSRDFLPTRVAYKLNLKGASFNVQSACSTALVATHLACQHLLTYQCDMALAGGATVSPQAVGYLYQPGSPASPDGHCRPFDEKAEGTVFSNAVGVVVLKRLSEALADGDPIYCVIRGTAVNNDGATKVGFTAPSVDGELRAILAAQEAAEVDPATISYIETHGTGTILGDPIEIEALTQAFRQKTNQSQFCAIGSVKSNIGHTDAAAGICGLIKTAMALKHQEIPPSINYEQPNPKIDFENSPFYVNTELQKWERNGTPRRAGVSAFGFGGTNAHIVLEEAPTLQKTTPSRRYQMLTLSARTETALDSMTTHLQTHLQANPTLDLADVAYTLHVGRADFAHRRMLMCADSSEAVSLLADNDNVQVLTRSPGQEKRTVAFMFSGQGSQYVNMGRNLYEHEPVFREQVDICADLLRPHLGLDLRSILYVDGQSDDAETQLKQTWLTQPALFTVEYALAQLLLSWDIQPQAMIGHSIGEYVAACLAGVFSLEDALAIVSARGQLMQKMETGSMLAVPLTETAVTPYLSADINLATINAPNRCVLAGATDAINALAARLETDGVTARPLHTSHAFHSQMMEPMLETFNQRLQYIQFHPPQVPYISNLTGDWITVEQATDPLYWMQHVRQAVRFADGIQLLAQQPEMILLEVGPGTTLRTLAQRHPGRTAVQPVMATMRHPKEVQADDYTLLKTVGQLWLHGVSFRWDGYYEDEFRHRVLLPTYPFERQRYWIEPNADADVMPTALFKQPDMKDWFYVPSWKRTVPPVLERPSTPQTWLVFCNNDALSSALSAQLERMGVTAVSVAAGDAFTNENNQFTIRPAVAEDYETVWQTLHSQDQLPTHVLHLWNVTSDLAIDVLDRSFYSLLYTAQAITKTDGMADVELGVVTNHLQQIGAEPQPDHPEKATVLGVCKIIPQEMMNIHCRSIDVGSTDPTRTAQQLVAELNAQQDDTVIGYRGWERWVQTYEASPVGDMETVLNTGVRDQGIYLITGGLGGIGLTVATYLAESVQAHLVLTTRNLFPGRNTWENWLATHATSDRTSERIRQVQALEAAGADVL